MEEKLTTEGLKRRHRVLLIEDQTAIRQMLAAVFQGTDDFEVVGEAEDVEEALKLTRRLEPDVIVLDWMFPGGGGAGFLRAMQAERLHSNVLVMSAGTEESAVREALTNGAKGYIEKVASLEELMAAVRAVAVGGVFFGPVVAGIVEQLVKRSSRGKPRAKATESGSAPFECDPAASRPAAQPTGSVPDAAPTLPATPPTN